MDLARYSPRIEGMWSSMVQEGAWSLPTPHHSLPRQAACSDQLLVYILGGAPHFLFLFHRVPSLNPYKTWRAQYEFLGSLCSFLFTFCVHSPVSWESPVDSGMGGEGGIHQQILGCSLWLPINQPEREAATFSSNSNTATGSSTWWNTHFVQTLADPPNRPNSVQTWVQSKPGAHYNFILVTNGRRTPYISSQWEKDIPTSSWNHCYWQTEIVHCSRNPWKPLEEPWLRKAVIGSNIFLSPWWEWRWPHL